MIKKPTFLMRFIISVFIVSIFLATIFGWAFLTTFYPIAGLIVCLGSGALIAAFIMSYDDTHWFGGDK